jgi:hypothetical protein
LFIVGSHKDDSIKIIVPEDGVNYLDLCWYEIMTREMC